jgi:hypothetical protein
MVHCATAGTGAKLSNSANTKAKNAVTASFFILISTRCPKQSSFAHRLLFAQLLPALFAAYV